VFGPLRKGTVDDCVIVGQIGQSLDGRVATESGHSKYINGRRTPLVQLNVIVGVGTPTPRPLTVRTTRAMPDAPSSCDPRRPCSTRRRLTAMYRCRWRPPPVDVFRMSGFCRDPAVKRLADLSDNHAIVHGALAQPDRTHPPRLAEAAGAPCGIHC